MLSSDFSFTQKTDSVVMHPTARVTKNDAVDQQCSSSRSRRCCQTHFLLRHNSCLFQPDTFILTFLVQFFDNTFNNTYFQ